MNETEREFEPYLKAFENDIWLLCNCFKIHRTLSQQLTDKQLQDFPQFWGISLQAKKDGLFIYFRKVFENGNNTHRNLGIHEMLNFCEKNLHIFSRESLQKRKHQYPSYAKNAYELTLKDIENLRTRLKVFSNKIGKVCLVGSKKIAHTDKKEILNPKIKLTNIGATYGEVWEIICFAKKVQIFIWEIYYNGIKMDLTNKEAFESREMNMGEFRFFDEFDSQTVRFFKSLKKS